MHSAALLQDGRVLIVGGRDAGGNELTSGEIFDTPASAFSDVDGTLKVARVRAHLRVLFDGKVQIIGGSNDGSMEIYDPSIAALALTLTCCRKVILASVLPVTDSRFANTRCTISQRSGDPMFDRAVHTITELNGQALVLGGVNSSGAVLEFESVLRVQVLDTTDKMDYAPGETADIRVVVSSPEKLSGSRFTKIHTHRRSADLMRR